MRKTITGLALVAFVAGVALVAISLSEAPTVLAQETEEQVFRQPLDDVLDELVEDQVITADQRDKIAEVLAERFVRFGRGHRGTPHLETVAEKLEMTVDDLAVRLRDGETIADVAGDRTDEVITALVAEQEARIDEAVADGRLTDEKAEEVRSALADRVGAMVNGEHPADIFPGMDRFHGPFGMDRFHGRGDMDGFGLRGGFGFGAIAEALGLEVDALRERLADGSSLADIAAEEDVDTQVIVQAILANLDEQLDALVANERLTRERADEIRAGSAEMIESMIDGEMPGFGFKFDGGEGFRGHGHRMPGFGFKFDGGEGFRGHGHRMPGPGGFFGTPDEVEGADTAA